MSEMVSGLLGGLVGYALAKEKPPTDSEVIRYLRERKPTFFKAVSINTAVARDNEPVPSAGSLLFVENPDTPTKSVYVRLNEPDSEKIDLTVQRKIKMPFYRFFITNEAGVGTLNLVVGKSSILELAGAVTNIKITAQTAAVDIKLTASAIMMPVDIQASFIMVPVDIQAQLANLEVDIVAQTIGNIGIDIKAQTLAQLNINIAASAITLDINIASQVANIDINIAASAATIAVSINIVDIVGNLPIDIKAVTIGNIGIDIKAQTLGQVNINLAASAITLDINIASQAAFNLSVNLAASAITLDINIASQAAFNLGIDIKAQTLAQLNINIAASAVTLDINIASQAAFNMNVNIAAQTANIDVNIAAQAANVNVNLAASAITMNVNISSQSAFNLNVNLKASAITLNVNLQSSSISLNVVVTGTANIQITAQTVGVYLQPDWQVAQGNIKIFNRSGSDDAFGTIYNLTTEYTVPGGKRLYITGATATIWAATSLNADTPNIIAATIGVGATGFFHIGGNGGFGILFPTPLRIDASGILSLGAGNVSHHNCNWRFSVMGYEVNA